MTEFSEHAQDIARRELKAIDDFIETLCQFGGIDYVTARAVFDFMRRKKLIKRDLWMGRYNVKHGAYLDRDFIQHIAGIEA
jgi:hypothetical protein